MPSPPTRPEAAAARFCKDCRWLKPPMVTRRVGWVLKHIIEEPATDPFEIEAYAKCGRPKERESLGLDKVSGRERFLKPHDKEAWYERMSTADWECGPSARFFEARHPSPPGAE